MGGGGYRPQDSLSAQRHTKQGLGGGVLFTYTLHLAIGLTTAHSGEPLAPKTVAWAVLARACCGGTQCGKKIWTARHGGGGVQLMAEVQWAS